MTRNPVLNALAATIYIGIVASVMYFGPKPEGGQETVLIPIVVLSLFSLSAAVMALVFFYQPVRMYLEGQKDAAIKLGMQTIGAFAVITAILLGLLFLSIPS